MLPIDPTRPVLVFGGPYSNLRAIESLRAEAERLAIPASQIVCTGDVVAYCAEPEQSVQAIRQWGCHVIAGNCEEQLAAGADDCGCGFDEGSACDVLAKGWYPFANSRMSAESRAWMGSLQKVARFRIGDRTARVVHGSTTVTNQFVFESQTDLLARELSSQPDDIVVAGHCGIPFIFSNGSKCWFNPGVVGMPANDGTADVWYGLMTPTSDGLKLTTHKITYDHLSAAAAMRRWAYADSYANALITGIWPSFDVLPVAETTNAGKRLRPRIVTLKQSSRRHPIATATS